MGFQWTKRAIEMLVEASLRGESSHQIARSLGCIERTVRNMQWELDLVERREVHRWTAKEQRELRRMYANSRTEDIARALNVTPAQIWREARRLGLKKSVEVIREMARERASRPDHGSIASRFKKGLIPPNKGLRRPGYAPGRMKETQFKKGERRGAANRNWKPVGTILADHEGFLRIKVREPFPGEKPTGFGNPGIWPLQHRHLWEQHNGPVPPGHIVAFKDRNRQNVVIENLECITMAENMRRNTIHRYPEELRNTIMLLGSVKRRLREKEQCQKTA